MAGQFDLSFLGEEYNELRGIVRRSFKKVLKKYPRLEGESMEDHRDFIKDETLLEIAEQLQDIATRRQRTEIDLKYGKQDDWK